MVKGMRQFRWQGNFLSTESFGSATENYKTVTNRLSVREINIAVIFWQGNCR